MLERRRKTKPSSAHFSSSGNFFPSQSRQRSLLPAPLGLMSSHIQSPVFYLLCVSLLTMSICLLWICHSLLISTFVIWPLEDVSPSESCYRPIFYLQTPSYSIPPPLILLYPSRASPHLAHLHSWEWTEKAEKIEKQACDSSTSGPRLTWNIPFSSFTLFLPSLHPHLSLLLYFVLA